MMVFRKRQVVSLALILMMVVAGYLQYNYNESGVSVSGKDSGKLGEAVYVDNQKVDLAVNDDGKQVDSKGLVTVKSGVNADVGGKQDDGTSVVVKTTDGVTGQTQTSDNKQGVNKVTGSTQDGKQSEAKSASSKADVASAGANVNDFFVQAKLDRETVIGKNKESLKQISEDSNANKEQRNSAYEKMIKSVSDLEKETKIETLIKEKGFENALVMLGADGSVDVVVKAPSLSSVQTAQIVDIVSRQANVKIGDIHVKSMY